MEEVRMNETVTVNGKGLPTTTKNNGFVFRLIPAIVFISWLAIVVAVLGPASKNNSDERLIFVIVFGVIFAVTALQFFAAFGGKKYA